MQIITYFSLHSEIVDALDRMQQRAGSELGVKQSKENVVITLLVYYLR